MLIENKKKRQETGRLGYGGCAPINATGIATTKAPVSRTGLHQFIEVIKDGKSVIFDNVHTKGIAKDEFIQEIGAMTKQGKVYGGAEILEKFTNPVK